MFYFFRPLFVSNYVQKNVLEVVAKMRAFF